MLLLTLKQQVTPMTLEDMTQLLNFILVILQIALILKGLEN